jgi:hypothetical protein
VSRSPSRLTRRDFIKATSLALPAASLQPATPARETLYNGIVLPSPWPPRWAELSDPLNRPYYLVDPPPVIDIDVGRQLFVDDFLIQESGLHRQFHRATFHQASPVLTPDRDFERRDPYAELTGTPPSPSAMVFSDGVFFDPAERRFKMWYMGGYQQHCALAISTDGVRWERPVFDVVAGTNIVHTVRRDSNTVWLDVDADEPGGRYKMAAFTLDGRRVRLYTSADGIHWRAHEGAGPSGDRSTFFYNPFRKVWVFSLRAEHAAGLNRYRRYVEARDFAAARWSDQEAVLWTGADRRDAMRQDQRVTPELYNLDAVAYESVLLGLFTMFRGERTDREKPNDICVGFSRDGFHWDRTSREPFIGVSETPGDWNWANVQSAGGCCLVVGDQLYFYVSGRTGVPGTSSPGTCSTGLATLRRDGFASMTDRWPAGMARAVARGGPTLTTRAVRFTGRHLFVNADVQGELRVEVLDADGRVIAPFAADRMVPFSGSSTRQRVTWQGQPTLDALRGQPVRFRFTLARADLYAFWVSQTEPGHSGGYVAAGGPGLSRSIDAP